MMDVIKSNKKFRDDCWKDGLRKAKKIRKLINKFSKDTFNREKTIAGGYIILYPERDKDVRIYNEILMNYREDNSLKIANVHVDMHLFSMGFRRFSADENSISFEIA